ncbi:MAG: hypothetical protein ACLFSQ_02850 [Candidatus Zixiibacteriota bacterium]
MYSDIDRMRLTSALFKVLMVAIGIFLLSLFFIPKKDKNKPVEGTGGAKYSRRMIITTKICDICDTLIVDTAYIPIVYGEDSSTVEQRTHGVCKQCYLKNQERADALYSEGNKYYKSGSYEDALYYVKESVSLGHPRAGKLLDSIRYRIKVRDEREFLQGDNDLLGSEEGETAKENIATKLQAALANNGWETDITLTGENNSVITITYEDMDKNWAEDFIASNYMSELRKGSFKKVYFKNNETFSAFYDFTQ